MESDTSKLHLFFVPLWHHNTIDLMVEIARRISACNSSSGNTPAITFLLVQAPHTKMVTVPTLECIKNQGMEFIPLGPIQFPNRFGPPHDFITNYVRLYLPVVRLAIETLKKGQVALILDHLAASLIEIGDDLKVPYYFVYPDNLASLSFMFQIPVLDEIRTQEPSGNDDPRRYIPGFAPISLGSLPAPTVYLNQSRTKYICLQSHAIQYVKSKGIIINSSVVLEANILKGIQENHPCAPVIYPIGPIDWNTNEEQQQHACFKWLDKQQSKSVLLLCFGNRVRFQLSQLMEIAEGLESSGQSFLWCIQQCNARNIPPRNEDLNGLLPPEFLLRTKNKGKVLTGFIPQMEILAHRAVGGFVTQCDWTAIQESIRFGVPMIAWPLCREQRLIAFQVVREIGVGVELKVDVNLHVTARELARSISNLMTNCIEGNRVRAKTEQLESELQRAMDIGGTSYSYMELLSESLGIISYK